MPSLKEIADRLRKRYDVFSYFKNTLIKLKKQKTTCGELVYEDFVLTAGAYSPWTEDFIQGACVFKEAESSKNSKAIWCDQIVLNDLKAGHLSYFLSYIVKSDFQRALPNADLTDIKSLQISEVVLWDKDHDNFLIPWGYRYQEKRSLNLQRYNEIVSWDDEEKRYMPDKHGDTIQVVFRIRPGFSPFPIRGIKASITKLSSENDFLNLNLEIPDSEFDFIEQELEKDLARI